MLDDILDCHGGDDFSAEMSEDTGENSSILTLSV